MSKTGNFRFDGGAGTFVGTAIDFVPVAALTS